MDDFLYQTNNLILSNRFFKPKNTCNEEGMFKTGFSLLVQNS